MSPLILEYPSRVRVAELPTRIERLARYSETLPNVDVWIKRDDLTGFELSGNKVRKLEFTFGQALEEGASGVVTCGGVNSNHCRATTFLARRLGLEPHLFLRTPDGGPPRVIQGNTLLNWIAGAKIEWITPEQYRDRDALMDEYRSRRALAGDRLYVIPEGASNAIGALGYVAAVEELDQQLRAKSLEVDIVVHAMGSGGTTAGLTAGQSRLGASWQPWGFAVCDDNETFLSTITAIRKGLEAYALPAMKRDDPFRLIDRYQGKGYGLATPEELAFYRRFCELEGILLDPCYTGKAFYGMHREVLAGSIPAGTRVLFWHTGGSFALFSYADQWLAEAAN